MDFEIRTASAGDLSEMHRLRTRVPENRLSDPRQVSEASYLPFVEAASIWVAQRNDGILGFAAIDVREATVWALFVDPVAEGRGIGLALHNHMIAWSRISGLSRLSLSTEKHTRAARFYAQSGWTAVGATPNGEVLFEMAL